MPNFSKEKRTLQRPSRSQSRWWNTFSACIPPFIHQNNPYLEEASSEPFLEEKAQGGTKNYPEESRDPFTPIIKNNWTDSLESWLKLKSYKNPNVIIENGHTPLSLACELGKEDIVKILLKHHADPNMRTTFNAHTPLMLAILSSNIDCVKRLLENKSTDIDLATSNGSTPLTLAVAIEAVDIVRLLLEYKAKPNLPQSDNTTPLIVAAKNGDKEIVALLIKKSATIDMRLKNSDYTALMEAVLEGHEEVVELLLASGANPNIIASTASTAFNVKVSPLILAIKNGFYNIAKTLLTHKADPNILNNLALLHAIEKKTTPELVKLLLNYGANPNAFGDADLTPLIHAMNNQAIPSFELLLNHEKIDVNKKNLGGTTALIHAVRIESLEMLKGLVEKKAVVSPDAIAVAFNLANEHKSKTNCDIYNFLRVFLKPVQEVTLRESDC